MSRQFTRDFNMEVASDNIAGKVSFPFCGVATINSGDGQVDIWDYKDKAPQYTFPSSDQTWYISSSEVADNMTVIIQGLDASHNIVIGSATLNGQNQVEIRTFPGGDAMTFLRLRVAVVSGATLPAGRIFIAETDALTSGEPDTANKVRGAINLDPVSGVSNGRTLMAVYTAPADKTISINRITLGVGKGKDARVVSRIVGSTGTLFVMGFPVRLYQQAFSLPVANLAGLDATKDFVLSVSTTTDDTEVTSDLVFIETDL